MKAISLFSGQGGLDIGVEDAGYEILAAIELNSSACETMRENRRIANMSMAEFDIWFEILMQRRCYKAWKKRDVELLKSRLSKGIKRSIHFQHAEIIESDIRSVDAEQLMKAKGLCRGDLDLIVGGPPCQSFSRSGKREAMKDDRGVLFVEFARFVDVFRPRWFVFENVKGMSLTKMDVVEAKCADCKGIFMPMFSEICNGIDGDVKCCCQFCGSVNVELREKKDVRGGSVDIVVNEFERLGYTCYKSVLNALEFGAPQNRERLIIVGSRDGEAYTFPKPEYCVDTPLQTSLLASPKKFRSTWECLFSEPNPYHHPCIDIDKAVLWVKNVVRPHDEPVTWSLRRPCPTVGAHQSAKLAIAPFGVPEEQLARQQWHVLGHRQGDTPPVPVEHTYLSDEDLLKLQTFPSYWFVAGTRMERAFQIGNAVPPVLSHAVARKLPSQ